MRVTLWLPDAIYHRARDELDDEVSWSALFRERMLVELEGPCEHTTGHCPRCHALLGSATSPVDQGGVEVAYVPGGDANPEDA